MAIDQTSEAVTAIALVASGFIKSEKVASPNFDEVRRGLAGVRDSAVGMNLVW
jgi:hypothetical protein